ncbi:hypothetical protein D3C76_1634410 [compost metagenome]
MPPVDATAALAQHQVAIEDHLQPALRRQAIERTGQRLRRDVEVTRLGHGQGWNQGTQQRNRRPAKMRSVHQHSPLFKYEAFVFVEGRRTTSHHP